MVTATTSQANEIQAKEIQANEIGAVTIDQSAADQIRHGLNHIRNNWGWMVAAGLCMILAGAAAIAAPFVSSLAVELFISTALIVAGIAAIVAAYFVRSWGGFFARLGSGLFYIAMGGITLANPFAGLVTLTLVIAAFFGFDGMLRIYLAIQCRHNLRGWGWVLAGGIVALAFGGIIVSQLPAVATVLVGLLLGVNIIFSGWAHVLLGIEASRIPVSAD